MLDIKKCRVFLITAETKKLSKTAELTGYTQSGISHILQSMEKEVGIQLFKRDRYGVHLTPLGADFLIYVKRFIAEYERLEQFIYDLHGLEVGTITIGTFTSVSNTWLPQILNGFHDAHPNIDIIIKEGGTEEIENWISNMEVDLSFYSKQPRYAFDFIHLIDDPIVAVLPPGHPMGQDRKAFPVKEFDDAPFILSETGVDYDIARLLESSKVHPNVRFSSKEDSTILAMVEQGLGLSILPELSTQSRTGEYVTMPLDPPYYRDLGIAVRSMQTATPIVRSFIYTVQDFLKQEQILIPR